jgi:glycosyltransferase involved in cell wall biosynthesis
MAVMKVLAYSRGGVALDKGTPLRFRHLIEAIAGCEDVTLQLVSRDDPTAVSRVLPGIAHFPADLGREQETLAARLRTFQPDIVYGQTDKSAADMAAARESKEQARLVVDLHGDLTAERLSDESRSAVNKWLAAVRAWINQKRYFPQMDAFTTVGQVLADKVAAFGKPVQVLWGGVNTDVFRVVTPPPSPLIRVAYAGNYRPYQGVTTLLDAAAILVKNNEPFHFILVGDIDKFPAVKEKAQRTLGERVTLAGWVAYEEVPQILGGADVLVVPRSPGSAANYNYPSKLSEYLSLGKPVVVHGVGEVLRVIEQGQNGLVVPPEQPEKLAEALLSLKDAGLRERLGRNGRSFAESHLAWPVIGWKLHDFFEGCLPREAVEEEN